MIIEIIFGSFILISTTSLSSYFFLKQKSNTNYGTFSFCLIKENDTLISKCVTTYKTEDEYEFDLQKIIKIARNKIDNFKFRKKGIVGFSMIDMKTGDEIFRCILDN